MCFKSKLCLLFLFSVIPFLFSCTTDTGEDYSSITFTFNFETGDNNQSVESIKVKYYDHFNAPIMNDQNTDIVRDGNIFYGWTVVSDYANPDYISTIVPGSTSTEDEWGNFSEIISKDRDGLDQNHMECLHFLAIMV